jgi:hypothetical protein
LGYDVLKYANSSLLRSPNPLPVDVKWKGTTLFKGCTDAYGDDYETTRAESAPRNAASGLYWPRENLHVNDISVTLR